MRVAGWRLADVSGVTLLRCLAIEAIPGVAHAFSTRRTPEGAGFDLGRADDRDESFRTRRRAFLDAAGLRSAQPALPRQVHGRVVVRTDPWPETPPVADGVLRAVRSKPAGPVPAVSTADCVPMLMLDRKGKTMAAVHAGWRGTAAGIAAAAVAVFEDEGVPSAELVVALGPAIGPCCYEVGDDVARALADVGGGSHAPFTRGLPGAARVDLHHVLRLQLVAAGVPEGSIHAAPLCTHCRSDLFFSFRAEGPAAGRLMAVIGPCDRP